MNTVILVVFVLSWLTFVFSKKQSYWYVFLLELALWISTSYLAINVLISGNEYVSELISNFYFHPLTIKIDKLAAFFILLINFTSLSSFIYAKQYLAPYLKEKSAFNFALHYFNFFMLNFAMLFVVMLSDGIAFLLAWELMSLSSFLLVIFESNKPDIIKTGIKYLVQMHVGYLFLVAGFVIVYAITGDFGFEGIKHLVEKTPLIVGLPTNFWIFIVFFIGFGIKAGFFPLHSWLPHAHPAAPSHVSGLMSGIMIKMGIYGIIRILFNLPELDLSIGIFILLISIFTGVFGVMSAIVQHDLKKLLAFHSIENIGIIGIGIGLGVLGEVYHQPVIAVLGWSGALLHILNHSLFKSLLFYAAGSVYIKTHTRNLNKLGGLIKKMPFTAFAFLIGAIAISGIPPFNGFISEFIIYNGFFEGIKQDGLAFPMLMMFGILALALIGGLAMFCFTKAFGVVFLGTARSKEAEHAVEVEPSMRFAEMLPIFWIIIIGVLPVYFFNFINSILQERFPLFEFKQLAISNSLKWIGIIGVVLWISIWLFYVIRKLILKRKKVIYADTWGCGYTAANPITNQYNASSFAANFKRIANPIFVDLSSEITYDNKEVFPVKKSFKTHVEDKVEFKLIMPVANNILRLAKKLAVLQTGKIQDYILYPLLFIIIMVVLTVLNII
jgi:formate hydrogenlyase subunit 3/multisubunit Na+/H+ antiporter MnhD subunit